MLQSHDSKVEDLNPKNPVKPKELHHSQFILSTNAYRDNNNFMRINTGINYNYRFWLSKFDGFTFRFVDYFSQPSF